MDISQWAAVMECKLNALEVAALLVSASYGIGFLCGSGEMAVNHGMAGSIYGLATAFGMLILATFAARIWRSQMAIWDLFGQAYGEFTERAVALLSVVWMSGVLAAQIHGGVAVAKLMGIRELWAEGMTLVCIFMASRLNLRAASTVFSSFLILSGVVLTLALVNGNGAFIYLNSPSRFLADVPSLGLGATISIAIAVTALVCTGADYHQFLLAAKRPSSAIAGCAIAGASLLALSFLPASVVLGFKEAGHLVNLKDAKQVVPLILSREVVHYGWVVSTLLLAGLCAAALGAGAAIARAMTDALHSAVNGRKFAPSPILPLAALAIAFTLATRGQGIIATMVSVNVIYITSVAVVFAALLLGKTLTTSQAACVMGTGCATSLLVYVGSWAVLASWDTDLAALTGGLFASSGALIFCMLHRERRALT
jgi:SSS family solute:Na+ symporter